MRPMASTPRIILQTGPVTRRAGKRSRSRCSSSRRALRRQGAAKHKRRKAASRQALLVFRSLDPLPRAPGNLIAGDGAKNAFPRSEPRTGNNRKNYLTGKAPYKSTNFQFLKCDPPAPVGDQPSCCLVPEPRRAAAFPPEPRFVLELTAPPIELVRDDCGHGWHRTGWRDYWGYWHWGDCVPNGKSASWLERGPGLLAW